MPKYKKLYIEPNKTLPKELMDKVVKHDVNTMEYVLERIYQGLVGELLIDDSINFPFIRKGDIVVLKESGNIRLKDFILYEYNEKYFLRRVLKIIHNEIYVAGDNEREYHITTRDKIIAKGISRIRNNKYKSFNLKKKNNLYIINKYYLQFLRFGNRVIRPESEESNEAMIQAIKANNTNRNVFVNKTIENKISDELDRELIHFINPDTLVLELEEELKAQNGEEIEEIIEEVIEETLEGETESEEEVEYVEVQEQVEETEEVEYVEVSEEDEEQEVEYIEEVEYVEVSEDETEEDVEYIEEIEYVAEETEENKE